VAECVPCGGGQLERSVRRAEARRKCFWPPPSESSIRSATWCADPPRPTPDERGRDIAFDEGVRLVESDDLAETMVMHTFTWVHDNPSRAELLMRFRTEDFVPGDWPLAITDRIRTTNNALATDLLNLALQLGLNPLDVTLAVIDIPAAAARRSAPQHAVGRPVSNSTHPTASHRAQPNPSQRPDHNVIALAEAVPLYVRPHASPEPCDAIPENAKTPVCIAADRGLTERMTRFELATLTLAR
jgi:hypothetical protein